MGKPREIVVVDQEAMFSSTLAKLYEVLDSIETHGDGEHGSTVADIARISTAIIQACAERRQQQRDHKRSLSLYDDSELVEYIKTLSDRRQAAISAALSDVDPAEVPIFG